MTNRPKREREINQFVQLARTLDVYVDPQHLWPLNTEGGRRRGQPSPRAAKRRRIAPNSQTLVRVGARKLLGVAAGLFLEWV